MPLAAVDFLAAILPPLGASHFGGLARWALDARRAGGKFALMVTGPPRGLPPMVYLSALPCPVARVPPQGRYAEHARGGAASGEPFCSPLPFVWLTRLASSVTSFQYRIASISLAFIFYRFDYRDEYMG